MAKMRVMLDTNIIIDVLSKRDPFYNASAKVWGAVETGKIEGYIAAHSVTTIFYILSRHLSKEKALFAIGDLMEVFSIAEVNQSVLMRSLALGWDDFKDAVQICAATHSEIDFFITRDTSIVSTNLLTVIQPEDFNTLIKALDQH
jgi:predicted nucleic acid-binding protein